MRSFAIQQLAVLPLAFMLAACGGDRQEKAAPDGAPPMPQFQVRAALPAGDRLAAATGNGQKTFSHLCGACHLAGGMGSNVLTGQQVAMGKAPAMGLLENREDLPASYVEAVVRNGKGAMPVLTRVDITDAELKAVAAYLGKVGK